jgi:hypothetical protein
MAEFTPKILGRGFQGGSFKEQVNRMINGGPALGGGWCGFGGCWLGFGSALEPARALISISRKGIKKNLLNSYQCIKSKNICIVVFFRIKHVRMIVS